MHVIKSGQSVVNMPAEFNPSNNKNIIKKHSNLSIISPISGASYYIAPFDIDRKIPMKAEGAKKRVWWYLDGKYIGTSLPDSTFFHDVPDGEHVISAADSEGRSAVVNVKIFTPGKNNNQAEKLF